jgi:hypothetical protein
LFIDVGTGLTVWYFVVFLLDFGTVLTVWYFVVFHGCWNCPDSVVFCCFSIGFWDCPTVPKSNRKTTKYHTVRTVPTSMKNNIIPHCQNSSVGTVLTVWYFVVFLLDFGNVLTVWYFVVFHGCWNCPDSVVLCSMKNNKIPHCQDSSKIQ